MTGSISTNAARFCERLISCPVKLVSCCGSLDTSLKNPLILNEFLIPKTKTCSLPPAYIWHHSSKNVNKDNLKVNLPYLLVCEPNVVQLWTHRLGILLYRPLICLNFVGSLIYTARLWVRILRASEAIWVAILIAQMPQNFSHMYLHMPSNRYISRFYEQSSEWAKLMTINSTAQPIETHRKLAGIFP